MKLGEIAVIRTGLILTRKKATIEYEIQKIYKLITLKNIEDDGEFNKGPFETFESNDALSKEYFTKDGDILIKLSTPFTTICIDEKTAGLLVPSYFSIIRLQTPDYIPEYITWYLNSDKVKRELIKKQTGTSISSTNNTILSSINIKEIPVEDQKRIARIRDLYLKEKSLLKRLIREKEMLYKGITDKLINMNGED
ncbi:MAG: restriction endonuclease subunit S [Caldicoprobacterales bacterium]|jgi:restriction endonuclease S subunit|nr:restriction endonuclease subunit S [Clostridiaceae bacterium]HHU50159.1 restriction endonuclease subunit S [Clostridiales bacterium]